MNDIDLSEKDSLLIFDFDGVLLNSVVEMSVTAYNAVSGELVTSPDNLPGNSAKLFLTNRYHVQPAGDALNLMEWCLANSTLPGNSRLKDSEYCSIRDGSDVSLVERTESFFSARKRFVDYDIHRWQSLNSVYEPVWEILKDRNTKKLIILTNKNSAATFTLCHHFKLPVLEENIYSGDGGITKINNLLKIHSRFQRSKYSFIDDSIGNLDELNSYFRTQEPVLELMLATWGYTGPEDQHRARQAGYPILDQGDLISRILSTKELGIDMESP